MRIVGGKFAGRDLTSPADRRVRPTAEHMRAALLDLLEPELPNARILDLYAGTGALGIEAISRGALSCDFVEWRLTSLWALKSNVNRFKLKERTRTFKHDAIHFTGALEEGRYDIAFCDPPYESKQLDWIIRLWEEKRFSRILAVEHAVTHLLPPGHSSITSGPTRFTIYRDAASLALPGAPRPVTRDIPDPWASEPPAAPRPRSVPERRRPSKSNQARDSRQASDTREAREPRESRESRQRRDPREARESRQAPTRKSAPTGKARPSRPSRPARPSRRPPRDG